MGIYKNSMLDFCDLDPFVSKQKHKSMRRMKMLWVTGLAFLTISALLLFYYLRLKDNEAYLQSSILHAKDNLIEMNENYAELNKELTQLKQKINEEHKMTIDHNRHITEYKQRIANMKQETKMYIADSKILKDEFMNKQAEENLSVFNRQTD